MTLVSPGVEVSVIDESFYSSAGSGTVPLIIFGTAENKTAPDGASVAEGTLASNAGKLYTISSQRELIQTFGNPIFYSSGGTPIHGYELNEYGLHAAYQYLGVANRAYVVRAAIDYSSLSPRATTPRGNPSNGAYWLDLSQTSFGIFESNGGSVPYNAFGARTPYIINSTSDIDKEILANVGYADAVTAVASVTGSLVINGVTVAVSSGNTLTQIVNAITAAAIPGIQAGVYRLAGKSYLFLRNIAGGNLVITGTTTAQLITDIGLKDISNTTLVAQETPKATIGTAGEFAVLTKNSDYLIFQKLRPQAVSQSTDSAAIDLWFLVGSANWKKATPTRIVGSSSPTLAGLNSSVLTINVDGLSGNDVAVTFSSITTLSNVVTQINAAITGLAANHPAKGIVASNPATALVITNTFGGNIKLTNTTSTPATLLGVTTTLVKGNDLYYSPHTTIPTGSSVGDVWVKTTIPNAGAKYLLKRYNSSTNTFGVVTANLYADDTAANTALGSTRTAGSVYVQYNAYGDSTDALASHILRVFNGTTWSNLSHTPSLTAITSTPTEDTLWYNSSFAVDIMVNDGDQWKGYRNYSAYSGTDTNGPILSGSAPTTQSGGSPLVDNDIWVRTSDLENYPKIYRFQTSSNTWVLIDNTDQTTPFGVIFADARWSADGTLDGDKTTSAMVTSDFVDPDAPDPRAYPEGMLLFNTRYSTLNVKQWKPNYLSVDFNGTDYTQTVYTVGAYSGSPVVEEGRWITVSGNKQDGSPYMGRKAQRQMIVQSLAATIAGNEDIRAETIFYNLISAPGYVELLDEMISLNTDKKEVAFVVGDSPIRLPANGTAIQKWANPELSGASSNSEDGLVSASPYAGIYYPWGLGTNIDGSEIAIPPSTIALRTIVRNDIVSYPWFAPAGFERGLVTNATTVGYLTSEGEFRPTVLSNGLRDVLYENKINPIAYIPNRGLVIYGQKTLSPVSSALDRINVARLINYIRYKLDNLSKPFLFEQNDQQTRDAVKNAFERFLGDILALRGLYDFIVICDETNNTPARIDRNELWIDVAIAPSKTLEFLFVPIRIVNTGTDLNQLFNNRTATQ